MSGLLLLLLLLALLLISIYLSGWIEADGGFYAWGRDDRELKESMAIGRGGKWVKPK